MSLTVAFITSRKYPKFSWFFDSLHVACSGDYVGIKVIVVDACLDSVSNRVNYLEASCDALRHSNYEDRATVHVLPKPTVWAGSHRLTKSDYWAKSNALNTALCLCRTDFFASVDDRCVLAPDWLNSVREAMQGNYAVCGAYEKRENMRVENGEIVDPGKLVGEDHRCVNHLPRARHCVPGWFFGCSFALPTEWALQVNGWSELLDGLSAEDTHFGHMLANNGFAIRFDPRMKVIQDRTPGECGPEMKRTSKERFQNDTQDKGHEAIRRFFGEKRSSHHWNIREIRDKVLAGGDWPTLEGYPSFDWFDGKPIAEFQ